MYGPCPNHHSYRLVRDLGVKYVVSILKRTRKKLHQQVSLKTWSILTFSLIATPRLEVLAQGHLSTPNQKYQMYVLGLPPVRSNAARFIQYFFGPLVKRRV